jgi:glycosyltransferase involved in cell wall biosynthesis
MSRLPISISLVIPVFNNAKTLKTEIQKAISEVSHLVENYELIICDDKSTDDSRDILKKNFLNQKQIKLLYHDANQGIARTLWDLYHQAGKEYIILFSVDGDWDTADIGKLIRWIFSRRSDIVIGIRNKSEYSLYRKIISFVYNKIPEIVFGVNTYDAGSIKIFKRIVFSQIRIVSRSLFFEAEFIIRATHAGHQVSTVPVSFVRTGINYQTGGKPKNVWVAVLDVFRVLFSGR